MQVHMPTSHCYEVESLESHSWMIVMFSDHSQPFILLQPFQVKKKLWLIYGYQAFIKAIFIVYENLFGITMFPSKNKSI